MIDQYRSSASEDQKPYRSNSQPDQSTRHDNLNKNHSKGQVDIIAMVRSLQRTAGLTDCFRSGIADCDDVNCDWRTYCLASPLDRKKKAKRPLKK
jgi:hypothetical protein